MCGKQMDDLCNCEYGTLGQGRIDSNCCFLHDFTLEELAAHFIEAINVYEANNATLQLQLDKIDEETVSVLQYTALQRQVEGLRDNYHDLLITVGHSKEEASSLVHNAIEASTREAG